MSTLKQSVHGKDWDGIRKILEISPRLAKKKLQRKEFGILWRFAPVDVVCQLLTIWPTAYKEKGWLNRDLIRTTIDGEEWDKLEKLIQAFPSIITFDDIFLASTAARSIPPVTIYEQMLQQRPKAPRVKSEIIFKIIEKEELEHFLMILRYCPTVLKGGKVKDKTMKLTPLLALFQKETTMTVDWIGPIIKLNPNSAKEKDYDGKYPLHLAYQHGASTAVVDMLLQAYPAAEHERDDLGRTPKELARKILRKSNVYTPINEVLVLSDDMSDENDIPNNYDAVVICRCDVLMRDLLLGRRDEDKELRIRYAQQLLTRHHIFETLLDEFSKMVGIDDKGVIQMAATIQAISVDQLSQKGDTIIDFSCYSNPGHWYQQEILKLVMRVYHEGQYDVTKDQPSVLTDAEVCLSHVEQRRRKIGSPPSPSNGHKRAFKELTEWLTKGMASHLYSVDGPVLKPVQSLFNKLFIRRGQTTVHVIGDMVRATLKVNNMEDLRKIADNIRTTFPDITENKFQHPDTFENLVDFLNYVDDKLDVFTDSTVIPYRFKMNSSQKKKKEPLWYNFNFFHLIPEYHRVGKSEMFVACELQIGFTDEINAHRQSHDAYERDRILLSQPLLKNIYDSQSNTERVTTSTATSTEATLAKSNYNYNCTDDDIQLIEETLFGRIASEVLLPAAENDDDTEGDDDDDEENSNSWTIESGKFTISEMQLAGSSFEKPEYPCINNRSLNWHASMLEASIVHKYAFIVAGPYKLMNLDTTKRYFVESFSLSSIRNNVGTVGLYAQVGPYYIQIACRPLEMKDDFIIVENGRNHTFLEQICPLPVGTTSVVVIVHGYFSMGFSMSSMQLSIQEFDVQ